QGDGGPRHRPAGRPGPAGDPRRPALHRAARAHLRPDPEGQTPHRGGPMSLLDQKSWEGLIYSGGWQAGGGGTAAIIEPATGTELARTGIASPGDVARAAATAAQAQEQTGSASRTRPGCWR